MTIQFFTQTAITILGYALSWLELAGVLTGLVAVWLASRGKVANFYVGLANNLLYFAFFYHQQLYSMMSLQAVYFALCCFGIYSWSRPNKQNKMLKISNLNIHQCIVICMAIVAAGILLSKFVVYVSGVFPEHFPAPTFPKIDALLTVASIAAQILLTRKRLENWALWILIDACSVVFYAVVGAYFTAVLYAVYCGIAIKAFISWKKEIVPQTKNSLPNNKTNNHKTS